MKPIISPWLIYLIDLFDNLKGLLTVALILLGCTAVVLSIIWLCVSGLLFAVTPSKDTMYTMIVLDNVTTDNIQAIGKTGKDVIDYITDQIDKVVNDKEENKK